MKRGAHIMAPGPAGVEGRFLMEIMLLLNADLENVVIFMGSGGGGGVGG